MTEDKKCFRARVILFIQDGREEVFLAKPFVNAFSDGQVKWCLPEGIIYSARADYDQFRYLVRAQEVARDLLGVDILLGNLRIHCLDATEEHLVIITNNTALECLPGKERAGENEYYALLHKNKAALPDSGLYPSQKKILTENGLLPVPESLPHKADNIICLETYRRRMMNC
jgi:hypothetical protein